MFCLWLKLISFLYVDSELNIWTSDKLENECHMKKQELDLCTCRLAKNVNDTSTFSFFFMSRQ